LIVLLTMAFIGIILFEVPGLIKQKMWRELAAFSAYLFIGMAMSIPQVLGIILPNPSKAIEVLIKPVSELLK